MRGLRWVLLATLTVGAAQADLDPADYVGEVKATPAGRTREQLESEIAREIEQQARQAQREADEQAQRRAQAEAEEARRPYPQRLLQARCTSCHLADQFLHQTHTQLGWHAVVARMRILNQAPLTWDEQFVVAAELARLRPAPAVDAIIEYGAAATLLTLPLALGWGLGRWRRHRHG